MDATPDPYNYSTETLLCRVATENAELRELVTLVTQDPERLAAATGGMQSGSWPGRCSIPSSRA
jgi:hypothetical protein